LGIWISTWHFLEAGMNKQEIDEMMSHLPSQRPPESNAAKFVIAMWFVMFVILCIYAPDIRFNPEETNCGNSQKDN
jgi:hypothetical protein